MSWYTSKGPDFDIVLSSRIRLARNLEGYPFPSKCTDAKRSEIIGAVSHAFGAADLTTIDPSAKSQTELGALVEKHYVSPEFAAKRAPSALLIDKDKQIAVMIGEEDHVRIQTFASGLALGEAFERAAELDDMLDAGANIAYSDTLGYLTHCPTNLGTGMRASVMMHLPALKLSGKMPYIIRSLAKLGITVRGIFGEGSESAGALYQLSNSVTLGPSEKEIIEKLEDVVKRVIVSERKLRDEQKSDSFAAMCDRAMRAKGILTSAYLLPLSEFMELWSEVRLGVGSGLIDNVDMAKLTRLMIGAMPNNLQINCEVSEGTTESELSMLRAKYVRENI